MVLPKSYNKMKPRNNLLLLLVFFLNSCLFLDLLGPESRHQIIKIINNSEIEIAFYPYTILPIGGLYPDTLLPKADIGRYCSKIEPKHQWGWSPDLTDKQMREQFGEADTLIFFVFSVETLNKYTWEEIREGYKILKRYDLSIQNLDSLNWTITYP